MQFTVRELLKVGFIFKDCVGLPLIAFFLIQNIYEDYFINALPDFVDFISDAFAGKLDQSRVNNDSFFVPIFSLTRKSWPQNDKVQARRGTIYSTFCP